MAGARLILIRTVVVVVCLLALWLLAGRRLSMLLDLAFTVRHSTLPVTPFTCDEGAFWIGELPMSFLGPNGREADVKVRADDSGLLVLSNGGRTFTLGHLAPVQKPSSIPGRTLAPESGDEVSFTVRRSLMSWPTPFEMNFMTGQSPSWKRHLYYHLQWRKRSGARLEMVWRYQQWFYSSLGWASGMMTGPDTDLIRVDIHAAGSAK
jgi:hypothetical protein